nr:diguanylate cyclase [Mariprofundus sp. NF]
MKRRILLPLFIVGWVIFAIAGYFLNTVETRQRHEAVQQQAESLQSHLQSALKSKSDAMATSLDFIARDSQLVAALKSADRQQLLVLASPLYERLNKQDNITHFYFHDAARRNILRVHKPEKYGDVINRFTALGAEKSGSLFSGLELGPLGTFTLRSVLPVFEKGQLIGYIELGQEIDRIIEQTHHMFNVELLLLIDKQYLVQRNWEEGMRMLGRSFDWQMLSSSVIVSQSLDQLPTTLLNRVDRGRSGGADQVRDDIGMDGQNYWSATILIDDAGGRGVASLVMLHDMTAIMESSKAEMYWFFALSAVISWSLFALFWVVLGRFEQELTSARRELQEANELRVKRVELALNIQRVLDEMLNISLPPLTMKEVLLKSLDAVLSMSVFSMQNKGAIFLTIQGEENLEMVAQRNLPDSLMQSCALLPFGKCLCGKAAATREIVFFNHLNEQHEIRYDGIQPHGHYCIPIISEHKLLGVLNAYVEVGHERDEEEEGYLKNVADTLAIVIERKLAEQELDQLAHIDMLTGLPNRSLFYDRLDQILAMANRQRSGFALFFLDLDHFKEINDTLGHDMGDLLLRQTANRLLGCVRKSDTVARLGGDEFTVILTETKRPPGCVELVANNILKSLLEPFELSGEHCKIGCSIGIAIYPEDGEDRETLLKHADSAMYHAKRERNSYCFFNGKQKPDS